MSDATRKPLRERIAAGRARQEARGHPPLAERAADARDSLTNIAREHPLLLIAGGLAVGVALSALVPRSPTRKLGKSAFAAVAALAEVGLSYGRQAIETAGESAEGAARSGKAKLDDLKGSFARKRDWAVRAIEKQDA